MYKSTFEKEVLFRVIVKKTRKVIKNSKFDKLFTKYNTDMLLSLTLIGSDRNLSVFIIEIIQNFVIFGTYFSLF